MDYEDDPRFAVPEIARQIDFNAQTEWAVAMACLDWYNAAARRQLTILEKREPPDPDFLCVDQAGQLWIEVTSTHYSQDHHRTHVLAARRRLPLPVTTDVLVEPEQLLLYSLRCTIERKCQNDYGKECVLVVRALAPITLPLEFREQVLPHLRRPPNCKFAGIYVCLDNHFFEVP